MTTIGSLCTGYGGLDLALTQHFTNARTLWASDIDEGPNTIIKHRFPHTPNLGDMTTINWENVEPVDVICGGTPCQDLSLAGRRAGMKPGTRSGLWESMFTAIKTLRPHLVVWENVQGAYSAPAFSLMEPRPRRLGEPTRGSALRALGRVLGDLANIRYDAQWIGIRASDVGAPHQRTRVFLAAYPQGDRWWLNQRKRTDVTRGTAPVGSLMPTPCASDYKRSGNDPINNHSPGLPQVAIQLLPTPKAGDADFGLPRTSGRPPEKATALATRLAYTDFGDYAPAVQRWEAVTRPAPAPTEPSPRGGQPRLSPAFVEWMMGLPQGWVTSPEIGLTRTQQLRALGNGVVPQQAALALEIMATQEMRYMEDAA